MFSRDNNISSFHLPTRMIKLLVYLLIGFVCIAFGSLLVFRPEFLSTTAYRHAIRTDRRKCVYSRIPRPNNNTHRSSCSQGTKSLTCRQIPPAFPFEFWVTAPVDSLETLGYHDSAGVWAFARDSGKFKS